MSIDFKRATRLTIAFSAAIIPVTLVSMGVLAQEGKMSEKSDKTMTSKQKFKNIKVLKDQPASELIPLMHKINDSLGVKCDFCHVVKADHTGWDLDTKPEKNQARAMITMTNNLNKKEKSVHGKITCFTCHRGKPEPEGTMALNDKK